MPRTPSTLLTDLAPGDYVRGYVHACEWCGTLFVGSSDARLCSERCRKALKRSVKSGVAE